MAEHHVGMLLLHYGRGPRDEQARTELAAALPDDAEVTEPNELGEFEVIVDAPEFEDALSVVFDAVAAAGVDDHVVFLEHPSIPGHYKTAPRGGAN
jgi:hypothetical protein